MYQNPGKCEGRRKVPGFSGTFGNSGATQRCPATKNLVWHEGEYAWLCPNHIRGANRKKSKKPA